MFKDVLRQLRIERNLKQADVAKALGVTAATIGNYEQGLREPRNLEMWQKIADYFDVPVNYLMGSNSIKEHEEEVKSLKKTEIELLRYTNKCLKQENDMLKKKLEMILDIAM